MASPQLENGHVRIANELWDALAAYRIPGEQRQCLDVIIRKTYGFKKKQDAIALSQFVEMTGMNKPAVVRALNGLLSKKIIAIIKKDNAPAHIYEFIKDYNEWTPLSKKVTLSKKIKTVIKKDNPSLSKKSTTKDNTTKDKKDIPEKFLDFAGRFQSYQQKELGEKLVKTDENTITAGAKAISDLVRLDSFDFDNEIKPALFWAVKDQWWSKRIQSLASMRDKSKNGNIKFKNIYTAYLTNKKPKQPEIVY